MEMTPKQARQYINDLMTLRNQRLDEGYDSDTFGFMVADAMNALELVYVTYRGLLDEADPTGG